MAELRVETRYAIFRRDGRTWCKTCDEAHDLERDPGGYVLWLTAAAARQRGLTHCGQCGSAVVTAEEASDSSTTATSE
jgi:hypothetical protein